VSERVGILYFLKNDVSRVVSCRVTCRVAVSVLHRQLSCDGSWRSSVGGNGQWIVGSNRVAASAVRQRQQQRLTVSGRLIVGNQPTVAAVRKKNKKKIENKKMTYL